MQSEKVELSTRKLSGEWHHGASTKRLVIICHGYNSSRNNPTLLAITENLNKNGYNTFQFNFTENLGGFDVLHQVQDISLIAEHFKDYDQLILFAHSFAALTAAIATIQIPQVKGLITLNGFFGRRNLGNKYRKNYFKFRLAAMLIPKYRKIVKYYKKALRPDQIHVPVLVIHTKADESVFIKQSNYFYKRLKTQKQFLELETANHGISESADKQKVDTEITNWLLTIF